MAAAGSAAGRRFSLLLAAVSTTAFAFVLPVLSPAPSYGQQEMQQPEVENAKSAFEGRINAPGVVVRSGPSENFYPTMKLEKGTTVTVVGIKYNWLKIAPPKGSFSYVAKAFVQRHGDGVEGVVDPNATPNVRAGSDMNAVKTTVQTKLQPGQRVKIIGEQEEYFKIEPPAGAYLYVDQKFVDAVRKLGEPVVAGAAGKKAQQPPKTGAEEAPPVVPGVENGSDVAQGEPAGGETSTTGPATRNGGEAALANGTAAVGPTTKPTGTGTAVAAPVELSATMDDLEAKFKEASGKPLVDQPLEELTTGYTSLSRQPDLTKQMRRVVDARLAALKVRTEARESYLVLKKNQADVETKRQALAAEREELTERIKQTDVKVFTAVGTLRTSSLQLGGGTLYRLTDPETGRTVVYLRSADQSVASLINQFIGVRGDLTNDPSLNLKVINNPAGAEVVDQTKVNGTVAAQVVPPSLLPKIPTSGSASASTSTPSGGSAAEPQ